ncbi:MAG: ribulokinase [Firmicutes bacterium]|nr:ribulokinase [Bacillota bacterium]
MERADLVIGIDFGTDSVRAEVVNAADGREEATAVCDYPRWKQGLYCDPAANQFRHHPLDYIESMETAVKEALAKLPPGAGEKVAGIGVDTTGSTPCAVDREGRPLALKEEFASNPNAMFVLWKDHTAVRETEEINHHARNWGGRDFTCYEGGIYSSEWFWAKIMHIYRKDPQVQRAAYSWLELCDWIPALLTGVEDVHTIKRSRCAAGHKAMWHPDWGGLPDEEFLVLLEPALRGLRARLYQETYTMDQRAGGLSREWAGRLGLRPGIAVAVGGFDAHMGAVGGGITKATLVKIMGTSTCDIMVASPEEVGRKLIKGICGQVDGSVLPGMIGLEAGQSAYGDVYAWFREILFWPLKTLLKENTRLDEATKELIMAEVREGIFPALTREAMEMSEDENSLLALDWLNGRRTPDADQSLRGALAGLTLGTTPAGIFRALVEATAFGARAIVDRFTAEGIAIEQVIAMGGIAKKNPFVMQVTADVLKMPIKVVRSELACALGAAIFAAAAAGLYPSVYEAQARMASDFSETYFPNKEKAEVYDRLYEKYLLLGRFMEYRF